METAWEKCLIHFENVFFFFFSTSQGKADDGPDESQIWCGSWWLSSNSCGSAGGACVESRWITAISCSEPMTRATSAVKRLHMQPWISWIQEILTRQYFVSASTCSLCYRNCDQQWLILTQTSSRVFAQSMFCFQLYLWGSGFSPPVLHYVMRLRGRLNGRRCEMTHI